MSGKRIGTAVMVTVIVALAALPPVPGPLRIGAAGLCVIMALTVLGQGQR